MKLLILLFLTMVCQAYGQTASTHSFVDFSRNGYSIRYPKSWRTDTSKMMGADLFILAPLENANDKFSENVNIMIQDLTGQNIGLEQYKQITENQLKVMVTDGKLIESVIVKSDKGSYYKLQYLMTQGAFKLRIFSICYIKADKAYLVTFTAEVNKYEQFKKDGEQTINSFKVIN